MSKKEMKADGNWLREHRLEKGWTQRQLADQLGLPMHTRGASPEVSMWELGRKPIPVEIKARIEQIFKGSTMPPSDRLLAVLTKPSTIRRSRRRTYTDDQRQQAVALVQKLHGNVGKAAKRLKIPAPTVHGWMRSSGTIAVRTALHDIMSTAKTKLVARRTELMEEIEQIDKILSTISN